VGVPAGSRAASLRQLLSRVREPKTRTERAAR